VAAEPGKQAGDEPPAAVEDADRWLDEQLQAFKARSFSELSRMPRRASLEAPPRLSAFRFTVFRTPGQTGGVEVMLRREARGPAGWLFREFEKFPNESFDEATMPRPHTIAALAHAVGRFECQLRRRQVEMHRRPSEMSLETFRRLGLHRAAEIRVFSASYRHQPRDLTWRELERLGHEQGGGWRISAPDRDNEGLWRKLLQTAMPLVLRAPDDPEWLARCISRLHRPAVMMDGCHITERDLAHLRWAIGHDEDIVLVTLNLYRDTLAFCGRGPLFARGVAAMAALPDHMHGPFTDYAWDEYGKDALRVLPRKRRK
jgi:hypothetical protein